MSYRESVVIRACDVDLYNRWKPSAMLEVMQDAAVAHCESVGLAREVTDAMGVIWVLSRSRVELSALPGNGDRITVETFAMPSWHLFYRRACAFRRADGTLLGGAQSYWLLMDIRSRRAVMHAEVDAALPVEALEAPARAPGGFRLPDAAPLTSAFTPAYTDFDINGHVNNTRYMDWCWNALGFDALRDRAVSAFDVTYERELLPGETVNAELGLKDGAFAYIARTGGARAFAASGTLRAADAPRG